MNGWSPGDFEREYGPAARWCEYAGGELVQFMTDDGEVLTGMVLYASTVWSRGGLVPPQVVLIVITFGGDEWWVSPANVVIPRC